MLVYCMNARMQESLTRLSINDVTEGRGVETNEMTSDHGGEGELTL
jgi:hypothetical protein